MKITMRLSQDLIDILEAHGTTVYVPSEDNSENEPKYHFLPYWFEQIEDGEYQLHMLDHLPKELLDTLNFMRDESEPLKQY